MQTSMPALGSASQTQSKAVLNAMRFCVERRMGLGEVEVRGGAGKEAVWWGGAKSLNKGMEVREHMSMSVALIIINVI